MFKSKALATLTLITATVALLSTVTIARNAYAAGEDVFMDEGNGDFDSMPAPPPAAEAPTKKEETAVAKAPEPRAALPAEEPQEQIPQLTDDSAPAATPAPTEDPSQPAAAQPKEKKASKKKSKAKKAAATASTDSAPSDDPSAGSAPARIAAKGSFVTTKEACPMMRSPASTGETMLTVKASKKIWVEDAGDGWVKAFNKAGEPGYVSKECVQ